MPEPTTSTKRRDVASTPQEPPSVAEADRLEGVALSLFKDLLPKMAGIDEGRAAERAFGQAKKFLAVADRIRAGGLIEEPAVQLGNPLIQVQPIDYEKNKPAVNEFGQPVYVAQNGDPCAFAPNLEPSHPINQRYWKSLMALGLPVPSQFEHVAREYESIQNN